MGHCRGNTIVYKIILFKRFISGCRDDIPSSHCIMKKKEYPYQNLSLKDMRGEEWKDAPDFEGYYEISNYGRVKSVGRWMYYKSLVKDGYKREKIMKLQIRVLESPFNEDFLYYLNVGLQRDNYRKVFKVARLVYYLFVKKFPLNDITKIVQYKDCNGLNVRYNNLELSNHSLKIRKTIARKRTPKIKPVGQYDLNGNLIRLHNSISQAANVVNGQPSRIYTVLNKYPYYYAGYLWSERKIKKIKPLKKFLTNFPKKVIQYNLQGSKLKVFESLNRAAKAVGSGSSNLRKALNGRCRTCKGYKWRFV